MIVWAEATALAKEGRPGAKDNKATLGGGILDSTSNTLMIGEK